MLFKRKKTPPVTPATTPVVNRDPLAAVPLKAPNVVEFSDAQGLITLERRVPVPPRYGRLLGRLLGRERKAQTALDENGTSFWQLIDGKRSLDDIANDFRIRLNIPEPEARKVVVLFTKDLMKRDLIQLKIKT